MSRRICPSWLLLAAVLAAPTLAQAAPPTLEERVFRVSVDQKPAGEYHMTIRQDGNVASMSAHAEVRYRYLIINYVYTYQGSEVWTADQLTRLESKTVDDRKRFNVVAWSDGKALRIRANGKERVAARDLWTTTYWRLPAAKFRNQAVPLLDADTGKEINGTLRYVGMEKVPAVGQQVQCGHWNVAGGVQVDLWYDGSDRLVREESLEDGHKTLLELIRVNH